MLDGLRAREHRGPAARGAVRMDRDPFACLVRHVGGGAHLLEGERLIAGRVLVAAGGSVDLDPVRPRRELLPGHALHFGDAIGGTGVRRRGHAGPRRAVVDMESPAGDEHSRPDHRAAINEIAHGDVIVVRGAEIANGRDAGLERLAGVFLREKYGDGVAERAELGPGVRAGRVVPVERHVGVDVDETGESGVFPQVDDCGVGRDGAIA